jgi:hypothetical protein
MKRLTKKAEQVVTSLIVTENDAEKLINERIELGQELIVMPINDEDGLERARPKYYEWDSYNTELLKRIFNTDELSNEYSAFYGAVIDSYSTIADDIKDFKRGIQDSINRLTSIRARLPLFASLDINEGPSKVDEPEPSNEIFIVHGRDEAVKQSVARFLEKLDLKPIILSEQPNEGKTVIEKFEAKADVGFAVVLLTPDDIGGLVDKGADQKLRARQNVIFELGYFVGKLGRSRVCALYNQNVELPSDIIGVAYVAIDVADAWRFELAKELKAAGYYIDGNKLL